MLEGFSKRNLRCWAALVRKEVNELNGGNPQTRYVLLSQGVAPPDNGIHELKEEIKTMKKDLETVLKQKNVAIKKDLEANKSLLEKVVDKQAKMLAYFTQTSKKGILEHQALFPLESAEQMETVDRLSQENKTEMINVIKRILNPGGLQKNFHRLVDNNVIFLFNYDGVNGKNAFKNYKSLNAANFDIKAVKNDGYTYTEYVTDIRESIKALKNRINKRKYDENKKNEKKYEQNVLTPLTSLKHFCKLYLI